MIPNLRARVEQLTQIATVPHIVARLSALMNRPSPSTAEVAEEISKDQVLSAKVLRLVNSGFCGFRKPISTIHHALVLLGLDAARSVVVSAPVIDVFQQMCVLLEGLWEHSLATARASHALAELMGLPQPEEVAVAGLLHDFGKVVIAEQLPTEALKIQSIVASRDCLQIEAEREVLGVTHQEVGMWLLKKWSLPPKLVYPIAYHNNFHPARDFAAQTAIVHVADVLVRARGLGNAGDRRVPPIDRAAWDLLALSMSDVADVLPQLTGDAACELV